MGCRWCWIRSSKSCFRTHSKRVSLSAHPGAERGHVQATTKIFVDNTKLFVIASAHESRTPAKAHGFRTSDPSRPLGARAFHGPGSPRRAERKQGPLLHHAHQTLT